MKHSLRLRITLILTVSIVALILICIFANELFLEKYYLGRKTSLLSDSYYAVNLVAGNDILDDEDEMINSIEKIEASYNVNIYIISENEDDTQGRAGLVYIYPIEMEMGSASSVNSIFKFEKYKRITTALQNYLFGLQFGGGQTVDLLDTESDRFDIYKYFDSEVSSYYIDLVGYLDNDYLVFIRSNYENITESAGISTRFLTMVGIAVVILGSASMYIISSKFTKPILELARISDNMANLNFEDKYTGKRRDEIGQLGNSINILSEKLENSITELKTANIELEKDIQKKIEIDEMRKEFLSNVSHELKTPIALIQGYAEGLQDNVNDDPESRDYYCEVIIDEARKMNGMVKKLLSLNEIEFGREKLDLERFDITALVRSVSASVEILAKQKETTIIFNEHKPIYVWADQSMIEEVITNYLSNALNHIDGQKIIDINFECSHDKVRVSVFNTGSNIPEEDLDNIWVKFYKVDKARTREYGGSGIGLSIVKAIMEQHNQKYGVINHSTGVEFWFELDIKVDE